MAAVTGIVLDIVEKRFPAAAGAPAAPIYRDFRLDVAPFSFLVLLAPSGSGKTTLLNMIAGLDRDFAGRIGFEPAAGGAFGPEGPRIAYAFQNPRLLPWRRVLDNVALPLGGGEAAREAALAMLREVGLEEQAGAYPERLSLGQQRRVALARAFVLDPDVLLMDEPFVSLDEAGAARLRDLLRRLLARRPTTVVFVTHDSREAVELGTRLVRLDGAPARIVADIPVTLSAEDRCSPAMVEALRRQVVGHGSSADRS
ncbi:ATP-binding cassette domain-containing protein [Ancylobacter oerskovii]|nr:ATP-binding cassette domain-containing protein [Ancylobacter oerskovii]